ncbi:MAG: hypothetical protein K1060chlam1_00307 [Candidatus Anoxychlamydiales bacterium]|nr:hypothetical protein [Candidatus Anoxychlamydiales bacterium]
MVKSHNHKKTPVIIAFGKAIKCRREELRLTQEELAEKASLHPTYVGSGGEEK